MVGTRERRHGRLPRRRRASRRSLRRALRSAASTTSARRASAASSDHAPFARAGHPGRRDLHRPGPLLPPRMRRPGNVDPERAADAAAATAATLLRHQRRLEREAVHVTASLSASTASTSRSQRSGTRPSSSAAPVRPGSEIQTCPPGRDELRQEIVEQDADVRAAGRARRRPARGPTAPARAAARLAPVDRRDVADLLVERQRVGRERDRVRSTRRWRGRSAPARAAATLGSARPQPSSSTRAPGGGGSSATAWASASPLGHRIAQYGASRPWAASVSRSTCQSAGRGTVTGRSPSATRSTARSSSSGERLAAAHGLAAAPAARRAGPWRPGVRGPQSSSRWTVSGENAGRQTATYSAPSSPGVE